MGTGTSGPRLVNPGWLAAAGGAGGDRAGAGAAGASEGRSNGAGGAGGLTRIGAALNMIYISTAGLGEEK
jgi:hypothetical protein